MPGPYRLNDDKTARTFPYNPVRMSDLRAKGQVLEVHCNQCGRMVEIDAKELPQLPDDLPTYKAHLYFKCARCGSKSITTRGQVYDNETVAQAHAKAHEHQRATLAAMKTSLALNVKNEGL